MRLVKDRRFWIVLSLALFVCALLNAVTDYLVLSERRDELRLSEWADKHRAVPDRPTLRYTTNEEGN